MVEADEGSRPMARRAPRWLAPLYGRIHLPRTVRMRLTLLCGSVILVSGGALLGIAFALGSSGKSLNSTFIAGQVSGVKTFVPPGFVPTGAMIWEKGGGLAALSGNSGSGNLTIIRATQTAARIGVSSTIHDLLLWSLVGLGVVTAIGLALGWGLSGRVLRPLRVMRRTTQHISEENLHERLALAGPRGDELKDLGDTIDELLSRLEAAFEAQRRFVQNAAHELRTPITMMRTSLEVAIGKPGGVNPQVGVLADKFGEGLDQAERLLEGFLALARAQARAVADRDSIALPGVVTAALGGRGREIAALGLAVEYELGEATTIGSATLVPQIVVNLVDNAIRHNEPGGWVRVTTETGHGTVRLVVENGGDCLDQTRVDELGQPFHRLIDRTSSDRGAGLGLSIVAAIVEAEDGTVRLAAREAGGLSVTVELPAAKSSVPTGAR